MRDVLQGNEGLGVFLPDKIRLLIDLFNGPRTPTELATIEKKHLSQISRTLRELRNHGLVEVTTTGSRERYYKPTANGYSVINEMLRLTR